MPAGHVVSTIGVKHDRRTQSQGLFPGGPPRGEEGQDGVLLDPYCTLLLDVFFWQLLSSTCLADLSHVISLDIKPTAGRYWGR